MLGLSLARAIIFLILTCVAGQLLNGEFHVQIGDIFKPIKDIGAFLFKVVDDNNQAVEHISQDLHEQAVAAVEQIKTGLNAVPSQVVEGVQEVAENVANDVKNAQNAVDQVVEDVVEDVKNNPFVQGLIKLAENEDFQAFTKRAVRIIKQKQCKISCNDTDQAEVQFVEKLASDGKSQAAVCRRSEGYQANTTVHGALCKIADAIYPFCCRFERCILGANVSATCKCVKNEFTNGEIINATACRKGQFCANSGECKDSEGGNVVEPPKHVAVEVAVGKGRSALPNDAFAPNVVGANEPDDDDAVATSAGVVVSAKPPIQVIQSLQPDKKPEEETGAKMETWVLAVIIGGCVILCFVVVLCIVMVSKKKKKDSNQQSAQASSQGSSPTSNNALSSPQYIRNTSRSPPGSPPDSPPVSPSARQGFRRRAAADPRYMMTQEFLSMSTLPRAESGVEYPAQARRLIQLK